MLLLDALGTYDFGDPLFPLPDAVGNLGQAEIASAYESVFLGAVNLLRDGRAPSFDRSLQAHPAGPSCIRVPSTATCRAAATRSGRAPTGRSGASSSG